MHSGSCLFASLLPADAERKQPCGVGRREVVVAVVVVVVVAEVFSPALSGVSCLLYRN